MVIKKFIAETMNEALAQVKRELGSDAVILQSRKIEKGGLLSFLGKQMVEVTAATPDRNPTPPKRPRPPLDDRLRDTLTRTETGAPQAPLGTRHRNRPDTIQTDPGGGHRPAPLSESQRNMVDFGQGSFTVRQMQDQLEGLRDTVRELATSLKYRNAPSLPPTLAAAWRELVDNGVEERTAHDLTQHLSIEMNGDEISSEEQVESRLHDLIASKFQTISPDSLYNGRPGHPKTIALIGPTGVGKTTTLAKMATNRRIFGKGRVALISTDTYRVAAVDQLKTFAGIAGLPMEVVYRPEELPKAIYKHRDKDVVLIDTAGRSQNDAEALHELKLFMDQGQPDEIFLVLSATTRNEDQRSMIQKFGHIVSTGIIVTKMDEVTGAGHLLDVAKMLPRAWTFITTGQNVPDDILPADKILLAAMVARKDYFDQLRVNGFSLPSRGA